MVMNPDVLVLDEPTSRLDPIATSTFLSLVRNINRELDVTVIISERSFEQVYIDADEVIIMDAGRIAYRGSTNDVARKLYLGNDPISYALPSALRIFHGVHPTTDPAMSPVTIHEARSLSLIHIFPDRRRPFGSPFGAAPRHRGPQAAPSHCRGGGKGCSNKVS